MKPKNFVKKLKKVKNMLTEAKNKKIIFFSRDPGAANCVIPVYKKLTNKHYIQTDLFGKDFALNKYSEAGLNSKDISQIVSPLTYDSLKEFLKNSGYTMLITGVESTDITNRLLWKAANELGIKSIAIIDQWLNYEMRFTFDELGKYKKDSPKIFPTFICTIDEYAKKEMITKGLPEEKIIVTGQPYFETVIERYAVINKERQKEIRKNLLLEEKSHIITFVSEPIVESYADPFLFGYTEFTILDQIVRSLNSGVLNDSEQYVLIIRLHPRNNKELVNEFMKNVSLPKNVKVLVEDKLLSQELISISDIIIGMSSMFLIEASLVGKIYSSVQIGLKTEDPFVLSRIGISKTILSYDDLVLLFQNYTNNSSLKSNDRLPLIRDASDRIIKLIDKIL